MSILVDDPALAEPIRSALADHHPDGATADSATAPGTPTELTPTFVVKGVADSGQPLLLIDQQGQTVSRARSVEEIVDAVAAVVAGFAAEAQGPRLAGRIVTRPDGSVTIVEPMLGRSLASLTPRLTKAGFEVEAPIEFGINASGQIQLATNAPVGAHSMLLLASEIATDQAPYLAAARLGHALITATPIEARPETLRRIAQLAESLESVTPIANLDANLMVPALTS